MYVCQAAYILMLEIRQAAKGTKLEKAQVSRLRESIIKVVGKVTMSIRKILIEISDFCSYKKEISIIAKHLFSSEAMILN